MKAIGVDLGGHSITAALVENGLILSRLSTPTGDRRPESVVAKISGMIKKLGAGIRYPVGAGIPGVLDAAREKTLIMPNFPGWEDMPLKAILSDGADLPVIIENDANCHALGEGWIGAAAGLSDFILMALGTGIGGGMVIGGRLVKGFHGMAGEPGHMAMGSEELCGCGSRGHLEAISGADALERQAMARGLPADLKYLWTRIEDPDVFPLWDRALDCLARAIASAIHLIDPQAVILGGGLSRGKGFLQRLTPRVTACLAPPFRSTLDLKLSTLGDDAPVIGAAALALKQHAADEPI